MLVTTLVAGICSEMSIVEEQMNDERTLTSALSNFEVEKLINSKMSELSEGQKKRVSLACTSIYSADVLLLDEPTNHLDSPSINLLIKSLSNLPSTSTTILISHNRHLIDSTCTHVCEIRELNLHYYPGNFSDYVKIKNSNIAGQISSQEKVNNERKRLIKCMDNMNVGDVKKEKQVRPYARDELGLRYFRLQLVRTRLPPVSFSENFALAADDASLTPLVDDGGRGRASGPRARCSRRIGSRPCTDGR